MIPFRFVFRNDFGFQTFIILGGSFVRQFAKIIGCKFNLFLAAARLRFYHEILRQADLDSSVVAVFIFPDEHARNEIRHTAEIVLVRQNEQHTVVVFPSERFLRNARSKPFRIVVSARFVVLIRRAAHSLFELFRSKRNDFFVVTAAFKKINLRVISYGQFVAKFLRIAFQVRNLPRRFDFVVEHKVGKARILAVFGHSEHAAHARPFNKRVARHFDFRI